MELDELITKKTKEYLNTSQISEFEKYIWLVKNISEEFDTKCILSYSSTTLREVTVYERYIV